MKPVELEQAPGILWNALAECRGPWRTPVLASVDESGRADARTVVLRSISARERELVFFTDRRSPKHAQLRANPAACLVVYDADAKWQARLYGTAREEAGTAALDGWWEGLGDHQRAHYAAGASETETDRKKGRGNFAAFRVNIDRFHCLWLFDSGNLAAEFTWADGRWEGLAVRP